MRVSTDCKTVEIGLTAGDIARGIVRVDVQLFETMVGRARRLSENLHMLRHGSRIERIKAVRDMTDCGLKEAVQVVDNLCQS